MTRVATILIALVLAAPLMAQDDNEARFLEKSAKTKEAVADAHAKLGGWCAKRKLFVAARELLNHALELVPGHEKAMEGLGYRKKRVDGEEKWVLDERHVLPEVDGEQAPNQKENFAKEYPKLKREAAEEYVKLAEYATRLELPAYARVAYETAVSYDPLNEKALAGAGWVQDELGEWISPREARERDETGEALTGTPEPQTLDTLPDWTKNAFKAAPAIGTSYGKITIISSSADSREFGRFAWAASKLTAGVLGGDVDELRVVIAATEKEHKDYCATRHPGVPGMNLNKWVVAEKEVEVMLDDEDAKAGLERIVYAVTVFEVRRRAGEKRHTWFEVGFASNMTRRLLGRVTCAQFSGESSGPTEAGRWKRTLRQLVADGRAPSLPKAVVARDPDEHQAMLAHYFVRYLIQERSGALPGFCAAWKAEDDVENAFEQAYEQDSTALEVEFLAWFKRN